jgi:hypothetical protein
MSNSFNVIPFNISITTVTFILKYTLCCLPLQVFIVFKSYTWQDTPYKHDYKHDQIQT